MNPTNEQITEMMEEKYAMEDQARRVQQYQIEIAKEIIAYLEGKV